MIELTLNEQRIAKKAFFDAVKFFGNQVKMAEALNLGKSNITKAKANGIVPRTWAILLEEATGINRAQFRPDIFKSPIPTQGNNTLEGFETKEIINHSAHSPMANNNELPQTLENSSNWGEAA